MAYAYCRTHNLVPPKKHMLAPIFDRYPEPQLRPIIGRLGICETSLDTVATVFTALDNETPKAAPVSETIVRRFAIDLVNQHDFWYRNAYEATVVDTKVGNGSTLAATIGPLVQITGHTPTEIASRLSGTGASVNNLRRARMMIALTTLTLGDPVTPHPHFMYMTQRFDTSELTIPGEPFSMIIVNTTPNSLNRGFITTEATVGMITTGGYTISRAPLNPATG